MPTNNDPSPESFDDSTLPTPKDLPSSHQADEFATVIPVNGIDDATFVPPVDSDATYVPVGNLSSQVSVESRVRYFGDYELISEIARGGMGVVYKARQTNLNRVVALKMILAGQFASEEDVQRFRTEAEAAANLDHAGIVPIYEIGQHEGQHFFSMGYVDGCSLADRVRNGPLPPKEAAELTRKIAEAIGFAHSRNVIHRDLKPANVLLDQNGDPKVTDFGLARKTDNDSGMTRTGAVMGTPSYMPPEQAAGKTSEVGPLSDVYSLGAILYCLLTGRPPFQAANPMDTLLQVMEREPVSVSTINPEIQRDLETICHKALQKEPKKRYESAKALADDLGRWLRGEPIQARAVSNAERAYRWVKRNPLVSGLTAATMIAMVLGTMVSVWFGVSAKEEAANARSAEGKARKAETKATTLADVAQRSEEQAKASESRARTAASEAIAAKNQTEATLARSNYFLALTRKEEGRVTEAKKFLNDVPRQYRNFEWRLAAKELEGSPVTLKGHEYCVNSVSFSPDGTRLVSGSDDNTIKLWDAATGEALRTLKGHESCVNSVSFSPGGTRLVSGSDDNTIKLWDATTGEELLTLKGHESRVTSVSFSPDGERIVSGSHDNTIKLWDKTTGEELRTFKGHEREVDSVSFSSDGRRLISGSNDTTVKLWDAETGIEIRTLNGHEEFVNCVAFSPDDTRLVSGSWDDSVKLWDATTGEEVFTLKEHDRGVNLNSGVFSVSFSPDGARIASGSHDNTVRLWDAATGERHRTLYGHEGRVTSVAFSPDGTRLTSGSDDGTVKLWDIATGGELRTLEVHETGVGFVEFSPDGTRLLTGGNNIVIWDAATGESVRSLKGHEGYVISASFSPDRTRIVSGNNDTTIKLWEVLTGEELRTFKGHETDVTSVSFSPDGRRLVSGSGDKTVKLWDVATGEQLRTLQGHEGSVTCVSFSPDGTSIASGSYDACIKLWDAETGKELRTLKGHEQVVTSISFRPDGTQLVSGGADNDHRFKLWDTATGEELRAMKGHTGWVSTVSFSPDGKLLVSGSDDHTIKLWDAKTGEELRTLNGHGTRVTSISFSPDGMRLASGSYDSNSVRFWDAATGEELRTLKGHEEYVDNVAFSPDSTKVMMDYLGTKIGQWDTEAGAPPFLRRESPGEVTISTFNSDGSRLVVCRDNRDSFALWNTLNGKLIREFRWQKDAILTAAFSHDDRLIASGSQDNTVRIWNISAGKVESHLKGHTGGVRTVAFFRDDTRLASGSDDQSIRIWNTPSNETLLTLKGHTAAVNCLAITSDDQTLISASADQTIRVWNVVDGSEGFIIPSSQDKTTQLVLSPDDSLLASVAADKSIVVWDLTAGERKHSFTGHQERILSAAFSKDGRSLTSFDVNGQQLSWNLTTGTPMDDVALLKIKWEYSANPSFDGLIALPDGADVKIEDLGKRRFREQELAFRRHFAAPRPKWHAEQTTKFELSNDWFAALFHRAWLLKINPTDGWLHDDLQKKHQEYLALHSGETPRLPAVAVEMLKIPRGTEFPLVNDEFANAFIGQIWGRVFPATASSATITSQDLQRLRDICQMRPTGYHFMILGITEYRAGQYDAAVGSLTVATDRLTAEWALPEPHPLTLGFLAMCHHQLGHKEEASRFLDQMRGALKDVRYVFDASTQQLTQEAIRLLNGADAFPELSSPVQIAQEATFENLVSHHWKIATWRNRPEQVSLSNDVIHEGMTALQIQVTQEADDVTLYQAVALEPNQKYRLTGWIRTDNVTVDPMETGTTGACLTIFGQTEISESVLGTSDWKQVAVEFTSGESSTLNIGCRLGHNGSTCTGTAWFDDLKLEKVE